MKQLNVALIIFLFILLEIACNNKKYTEVVEVPLPSAEENLIMGIPDDVVANEGAFQLEKISFGYDAFAPHISAITMENHYSKHYLTYTNNLNKVLIGTAFENLTIEEVLAKLDPNVPEIKNNAGGYYNHSLYFKCLKPKGDKQPNDSLAVVINEKFGSFENFTNEFKTEASKVFGSGWVWLIVDKSKKLQITTTQNQDNPLMRNAVVSGKPILSLDLWEHAYYIDYQYKRTKYIDAFFNVINWQKVSENYKEAIENNN